MIKHINTGVTELIAVKVPDHSHEHELYYSTLCSYDETGKSCGFVELELKITRNYQLLGIAHELTEEVWDTLVDKKPDVNSIEYFEDYSGKGWGLDTATASGLSLLEANEVYAVNPYEDKEESDDGNFFGLVDAVMHRQAQQNTGKWVLLKKVEG